MIKIPEFCLVVLVGPSSSGKSTFAHRHFQAAEIVSSDACRAMMANDEGDQSASADAFELLYFIVRKRLKNRLLTVIDATNVRAEDRKKLIEIAREYHAQAVCIAFRLSKEICLSRHAMRTDRHFGAHAIRNQWTALHNSRKMREEGFRFVFELGTETEVDAVMCIKRTPLNNNFKQLSGPFDIIGDVHGCFDELIQLLEKLGYAPRLEEGQWQVTPPAGRKLVFVGDLVDRGPNTPAVLELVMRLCKEGKALSVPGNHDDKLMRMLQGKKVQLNHGLEQSKAQLEGCSLAFREAIIEFIDHLPSHLTLDDGKLIVAHAGLREDLQQRSSGMVREFCLYGETTGEIDSFGLPIRGNWAADYRGKAMVVYGHTPVQKAQWYNHTIDIDTGCVFGGALSALRYPEKVLLSVPALQAYAPTRRPMNDEATHLQAIRDQLPDLSDYLSRMRIELPDGVSIDIREANAMAALELISRFSINPKWLIYLPPTMSPCETSHRPDYLEHPDEALAYFRNMGIEQVVCEEKHMGSRAMVVLARDESVVAERFGIHKEGIGVIYTRTGRAFFDDKNLEQAFLKRLRQALEQSNFWQNMGSDWVCLDCELMPWSAKAQGLLQNQYAGVGSAARFALNEALTLVNGHENPDLDLGLVSYQLQERLGMVEKYIEAYRRYCWPVNALDDFRLAPFHILATEGQAHTDKDHQWHMEHIHHFCAADPGFLLATNYRVFDLNDKQACAEAVAWWEQMTNAGGEGMVVKSLDFLPSENELASRIQPMIKCRGREYLRLIYGPEYTAPSNLDRLRKRGLKGKRNLAWREFRLGVEGLRRFVNNEPLHHWHACAFGVLALESEALDPRL
jgi:protein phosphatase